MLIGDIHVLKAYVKELIAVFSITRTAQPESVCPAFMTI